MSRKEELFAYALNTYGVEPDYPFSIAPSYAVLRHQSNRKWFALFGDVKRCQLGLDGDEKVDIVNLKCGPILAGSLRLEDGYFPAYHMKHDGWVSVLLDGSVAMEDIIPLLDMSYELTTPKLKGKRKKNQ